MGNFVSGQFAAEGGCWQRAREWTCKQRQEILPPAFSTRSENRDLVFHSFFPSFSLFLSFLIVSSYLLSTYFQSTFPSFSAVFFDSLQSFSYSLVRFYPLCILAVMNSFLLPNLRLFLPYRHFFYCGCKKTRESN